MAKLSEKEKQMFLALNVKKDYLDCADAGIIPIGQFYDSVIVNCFMNKMSESWATESLRRCFDGFTSGNIYRNTPEFEELIKIP